MARAAQEITAIIFDCDGVLVNSEEIALEIELAFLSEAGLSFDKAEHQHRFMGVTWPDYAAGIAAEALRQTGKPLRAAFLEELLERVHAAYEERLQPIPGMRELAAHTPQPKAVASSSHKDRLHWKLERTGLKPHFDPHIYSAEDVKRGKPAPDLFLYAAERIGAEPSTTLVIEDSAHGIKAAKAAGMIAAGFTAGGHCLAGHGAVLSEAGADLVFASLADLGAFLKDAG